MAQDPNANYYQPSLGSMTGFDRVDLLSGNPNIAVTGWSIEQLRAFLTNQSDLNFPSPDFLQRLQGLIESHLNDFSNPHEVTLDQIVGDFVLQVLGSITPGTPPDLPPFYAFDALYPLPLGTVFPASYTNTNLYRMTEGGTFVDPSVEGIVLGTDYSCGDAGVPLFSQMTNIVPSNWAVNSNTPKNTTLAALVDPTISYPFPFYTVSETGGAGDFGILIPATEVVSTVYTATAFIYPSATTGSLLISQPNDSVNYVILDLVSGNAAIIGSDIAAQTVTYPSGVIKVSFSFTSFSPTVDAGVLILHRNSGDTSTTRLGTTGRALFSIGNPYITKAPMNQPTPIAYGTSSLTSAFTANLLQVQAPAVMSQMMMMISLHLEPTLPSATVDTTILNFDGLTITRNQTTVSVKVQGVVIFTSPILEGLNRFSLSYSPTKLVFKDLASDRQVAQGTYPPLSSTTLTIGPCSGYLQKFSLYSQSDTNRCVEFLTNG